MATPPWWKTATGYQIYPRSFCDSNGDGIGDLRGIISKLDHLADLGIGFVWLSPVYASPMEDNGYDISDYMDIAPEFGTLADFDDLLVEARARDIRIVMDLVVNHCSDQHAWFKAAIADPASPYHDYFYWRDARADGTPPDDQRACFGGSAWHWVESLGNFYYGHFSPYQPDLNWENPALRADIYKMMNWWLDKGLGGFRLDVIDLLGKDLENRIYSQAPDMFRHLAEMHEACFAGRDILTVGETWSATPDNALMLCGQDAALDMVFNFNHIEASWDPAKGRWGPKLFHLPTFKRILADWQDALKDDGWNALYLSNHDLPRAVSFFGDDGAYRVKSAKMLALVTHLMKGTPFVYQGEEIAMTNTRFDTIAQFRDIEILGNYKDRMGEGMAEPDFIAGANANGRDNARTPVQWDGSEQAGFTSGTPWIDVNSNADTINAAADRADPDGVFAFYQTLIRLRRDLPVVTTGNFTLLAPDHPTLFAYMRETDRDRLIVVGNFSDTPADLDTSAFAGAAGTLLSNTEAGEPLGDTTAIGPWQGTVWHQKLT